MFWSKFSPSIPFNSFAILLILFVSTCGGNAGNIRDISAKISSDFGVESRCLKQTELLPRSVIFKIRNGESAVKVSPIDDAQYLAYLKVVQKALLKYPPALIKKHLKNLYIGGPYQENDALITGMYEGNKIYLFYNHKFGNNSSLFLEQTFHHEFSSILIQNYDFPAFEWLKLNPKDFKYIINPVKIDAYMNSIDSYEADEAALKEGLVSRYGKVNAENDINTYAELVFTQPEEMKMFIKKYPVVMKKYQMLKQFYLSISPEFKTVFGLIDG
jgi:hypothetical protein